MSIHIASREHEVCYQDLCALISKHAAKLSKIEVLAIAANMVGKLVAMQDQRAVSVDLAMETVARNLERGNQDVLEWLRSAKGGRA
jgi:hypothetical protein